MKQLNKAFNEFYVKTNGIYRFLAKVRTGNTAESPTHYNPVAYIPHGLICELLKAAPPQTLTDLGVDVDNEPEFASFEDAIETLTLWGITKSIYSFDQTLSEELAVGTSDKIPVRLLERLPEYAICVETPFEIEGVKLDGFVACLLGETGSDLLVLKLNWFTNGTKVFSTFLDLEEGKTIDQMLDRTLETGFTVVTNTKAIRQTYRELLRQSIPYLLFLCSDNLAEDHQGFIPNRDFVTDRLKGNFESPKTPKKIVVGGKTGKILRLAQETVARQIDKDGKRTVRPHLRRGHYHGYYYGARQDCENRQYRVKWVLPTFVNCN